MIAGLILAALLAGAPAARDHKPTPLKPDNNPADWITDDDYPPAALREHEEGVVGFKLSVDATGAVAACEVTGSSGSPTLDAATCNLLTRRAHFTPARDPVGNALPAFFTSRVRWQLPELPPTRLGPWAHVMRVTVRPDFSAVSCVDTAYGEEAAGYATLCQSMASFDFLREQLGSTSAPATVSMFYEMKIEGTPPTGYTRPAGRELWSTTATFDIDAQGVVQSCYISDPPNPESESLCHELAARYLPLVDASGKPVARKASFTAGAVTDVPAAAHP